MVFKDTDNFSPFLYFFFFCIAVFLFLFWLVLIETTVGYSLIFITPPTSDCLLCERELQFNHQPTSLVQHTLNGPILVSKYILRCEKCPKTWKLSMSQNDDIQLSSGRSDILYHPDMFGTTIEGYRYYPSSLNTSVVRGSHEVYFSTSLHSWNLVYFFHWN